MELLGSDDLKRELIKKSARHREELESEIRLISDRTEKAITNALIIGGSLAVTYFLVRQFTGSSSSKKTKIKKVKPQKVKVVRYDDDAEEVETIVHEPAAPSIMAQVGTALASQATALLLTLAKEKLTEYLESQLSKRKEP